MTFGLCSAVMAALLSGCSDPLSCSSDDAKQLVIDIIKRQTPAPEDVNANRKIEVVLNVADIRTEEIYKELKKVKCAANLNMGSFITLFNEQGRREVEMTGTLPEGDIPFNKRVRSTANADIPVIYELQTTSEGRLYATVQFLK